jgi:hypothetical protein
MVRLHWFIDATAKASRARDGHARLVWGPNPPATTLSTPAGSATFLSSTLKVSVTREDGTKRLVG